MIPSPREASTSAISSRAVCALPNSSRWRTPKGRSTSEASPFSDQISGRNIATNALWIGARRIATRSGAARARFFGIISPTTMCKNTTSDRLTANAMPCSSPEGRPRGWRASSNRPATAGSATAPSPSDAIVIPSCAPDSVSGRRRIEASARLAERDPSAAKASRRDWRAAIEREFRGDEDAVEDQQQRSDDQRDGGHDRPRTRRPSRACSCCHGSWRRTDAMRLRSISTTSSCHPSTRNTSPSTGIRWSASRMNPANVS